MGKEKTNVPQSGGKGRKPKADPAVFRYSISFNSADYARFLALFEQSGMRTKAHFITERIFGGSFKVIKIDKAAVDYYTRLTTFYAQFRAIGVNYNQIVKALNTNFTEIIIVSKTEIELNVLQQMVSYDEKYKIVKAK